MKATASTEKPRAERRIAVRLPLTVRGRDSRGVSFVEETASENLCRGGAAFVTRFDVAVGSDLEIYFPSTGTGGRRKDPDFETQGRVVHVRDAQGEGERFVGVQFTGPRFRRFFHSESAA
jgi:PilZ domain